MRPGTAPATRSPGGGAPLERRGLHGTEIRRANGAENSVEQQTIERQFVRWLLSRGLTGVQEGSIAEQMRDGTVLAELIIGLDPKLELKGLNKRALSRAAALANIELSLGAVWRKGALPAAMPSAEEVYLGRRERVMSLLHVVLDVFFLRPQRKRHTLFLQWVQSVVEPYNISLSEEALQADITTAKGAEVLWRQLADGVVLFCIAHSAWPASLRPAPHASSIFAYPHSPAEAQSNLATAFSCLAQLQVPVFITPEEFASPPAHAMLLLQSYTLHAALAAQVGQHAGQTASALADKSFRDHGRLLEREYVIRNVELGCFKGFREREAALEAECQHLYQLRHDKSAEAATYEALLQSARDSFSKKLSRPDVQTYIHTNSARFAGVETDMHTSTPQFVDGTAHVREPSLDERSRPRVDSFVLDDGQPGDRLGVEEDPTEENMPRVPGGSLGGGRFLMGEVPL